MVSPKWISSDCSESVLASYSFWIIPIPVRSSLSTAFWSRPPYWEELTGPPPLSMPAWYQRVDAHPMLVDSVGKRSVSEDCAVCLLVRACIICENWLSVLFILETMESNQLLNVVIVSVVMVLVLLTVDAVSSMLISWVEGVVLLSWVT